MPGRRVRVAGAVVLAAVLLAAVLREVSPSRVASLATGAPPGLLLAACAAAAGFQVARVLRYRTLLSGEGRRVRALPLAGASVSAWGVSLALPGLVGDAFFVLLLRRTSGVALVRGAGVALVARAFDVGSLAVIVLVTAPLAGVRLPAPAFATVAGVAAGIAAVTASLLWPAFRRALITAAGGVPRLATAAGRLEEAFSGLHGVPTLAGLTATTLLARLCSAFEYLALFAAVGLPLGFWQASFTVSARTLLLAFPVQGVAGLGTTQVWWTAGLLLLGWRLSTALAASLAVHLLDLAVSLPVALLGLALLLRATRAGARAGRVGAPAEPVERTGRVVTGGEPAVLEAGGD
ncbi:MAG: lysylphosphatidylglycerol synthase transmembrane domain-containing protein [Candidatus Dormibacterales bacterium]